MKIDKIEINAFGKLKNFSLDFSDNINVVFGENENGKSTVMAFIKAMFYGFGKKPTGALGEMEKYTPWQGGKPSGKIYFSHNNTNYCLQKELGKTTKTDNVLLRNTDTGETVETDGAIGLKYFGISEEAFLRSAFIGNGAVFISNASAAGDLNLKLSSAATTGDTDVSKDEVIKRLEKNKTPILSKTGKAGNLVADKDKLSELKEHLESSLLMAKAKKKLTEKNDEIKSQMANLESKLRKCRIVLKKENEIKNAAKYEKYIGLKTEIDGLNEKVIDKSGKPVSEMFLNTVNAGISKYEKLSAKLDDEMQEAEKLQGEFEKLNNLSPEQMQNEYEELKRKREELQNKRDDITGKLSEYKDAADINKIIPKKPFNPLLLVIGLLLSAAGAVLAFAVNIILSSVAALGLILFILAFVVKPIDKIKAEEIKQKENEYKNLLDQRQTTTDELTDINSKLSDMGGDMQARIAVKQEKEKLLNDKKNQIEELNQKLSCAEKEVISMFSQYKDCEDIDIIKSEIKELGKIFASQKELKLQLNLLGQDLGSLTAEEMKEKLKDIESEKEQIKDLDFEKIHKMNDDLTNRYQALSNEITEIETRLKTEFRSFVNPQTLEREIAELSEVIESKERFCNAVLTAVEVINESAAEMRKSYGVVLEQKTAEIFSKLTDGRYENVILSNTFDVSAEQKGEFGAKEIGFLSKGTAEQAYLSLRLAMAQMLSGEESLPIFLDDALSDYDDTRTNTALAMLKEYSASHQIILFTCHGALCDAAKQNGINVINPFN